MGWGAAVAVTGPRGWLPGAGEKTPVGHSNLLDRRPIRVIYPGGPGRRRDRNRLHLAARLLVVAAPAVVVLQGSPSTTAPPSVGCRIKARRSGRRSETEGLLSSPRRGHAGR